MAKIVSQYTVHDLAKVQAAVDKQEHGYQEMLGAATGFALADDKKTVVVAPTWHIEPDGTLWTEDARYDGVQDPEHYKVKKTV